MKAPMPPEAEGKIIKVGIYIRKSRKDKEGGSHRLTVQRDQLPAYARAQAGWQYQIYDDGYASAARGKADELRERARLKDDICNRKIDVVLCIELSRLSRDETLQDYMAWLHLCGEYGVRLATMGRILDPSQESDWMLLLMEGGFSSVEMKTIMRRMKEGRRQAYQDGKWLGGQVPPPYRYDYSLGRPVVDENLLEKTRRLWTLAETKSARGVAKELGLAEITVRRAISDDRLLFYQGLRADIETGELIRCDWEPVMDAEQAARIRAARRYRRSSTQRRHAAALLSNLRICFCGYCGRTVKVWQNSKVKKDGTRVDYYGCQTKNERGVCRESRIIKQEDLDQRVITNLFGTLACLDGLKSFWLAEQERQDPSDKFRSLDAESNALERKKRNLVEAIADGTISRDDARRTIDAINADLENVEKRRAELKPATAAAPDWSSLDFSREEFSLLSFDDKREFIVAAIERIELFENYAIIKYLFPRRANGDCTARIHLPPSLRRKITTQRRVRSAIEGGLE